MSRLTPNTFEATNGFLKLPVHSLYTFEFLSLSSYWFTGFSDVHNTPLKRDKWRPVAFQKKSVQICQPIGRMEIYFAALESFW
jgi:hypothetical protein